MPCISRANNPEKENSKELEHILKNIYQTFSQSINVLLLGTGESGKTTICKQMKILHINGFTDEEKSSRIPFIKQNVHESVFSMVSASSKINPPVEIKDSKAKQSAAYILQIGPDGPPEWTNEYIDHVKILWADPDIQTVFQRSNEYQLIDSTQQVICLFLQVFDGGIQAILFLIAASDFDQTLREDERVNRLKEAFHVYEEIFWSRFVRGAGFLIFLNKQDLLRKKIESGRKIENYFPDYINYKQTNGTNQSDEYEVVKGFLKHKIMEISQRDPDAVSRHIMKDVVVKPVVVTRNVYVHYTTATDTDNVKLVFNDVRDLIIEMNVQTFSPI
ncbi:gtp-binding protein alpha subunit [Holotrichia oblita]|uniref:Gtp-binding protein alpha subunit n=1 Tax=Holotrichia oblita TaxID=644536 RepID=A0ACB9TJU2_HOLOL|nr:gtp-binding protein alpha subunit [Holotrichia oblita]